MTTMLSTDATHESEFAVHLAEMRRRWPLVALSALAVAAFVGGYRSGIDPTYEASTTVRLTTAGATAADPPSADAESVEFLSETYAELAATDAVAGTVAQRLTTPSDPLDGADVADRLDISVKPTPGFIDIEATDDDPDRAAALAATTADVLAELVATDTSGTSTVTVVDQAEPPSDPTGPRPLTEAILAGLVAAIIAAEASVLLPRLRGRLSPVAPAQDVARLLGVPVLDVSQPGRASSPVGWFLEHLGPHPIITIAERGDGPDSAVATLGHVAGALRRRVLIVDGNRAPSRLPGILGVSNQPGMAEVLDGTAELRSVVQPATSGLRAAVLAAGRVDTERAVDDDRVASARRVVATAGADHAIVVSGPATTADDLAIVVHTFPDAVVASFSPREMTRRQVRRLAAEIERAGGHLVGVVLTPSFDP